jgi:hypothetical protein
VLFDTIQFEAPEGARLAPTGNTVIRSVKTAPFAAAGKGRRPQLLLVDVQQFKGDGTITVEAGDCPPVTRTVEPGRTILEVPVPPVRKPTPTRLRVRGEGRTLFAGTVTRSPVPPVTPADYVNVFMGTAYSRWMIAPVLADVIREEFDIE